MDIDILDSDREEVMRRILWIRKDPRKRELLDKKTNADKALGEALDKSKNLNRRIKKIWKAFTKKDTNVLQQVIDIGGVSKRGNDLTELRAQLKKLLEEAVDRVESYVCQKCSGDGTKLTTKNFPEDGIWGIQASEQCPNCNGQGIIDP